MRVTNKGNCVTGQRASAACSTKGLAESTRWTKMY